MIAGALRRDTLAPAKAPAGCARPSHGAVSMAARAGAPISAAGSARFASIDAASTDVKTSNHSNCFRGAFSKLGGRRHRVLPWSRGLSALPTDTALSGEIGCRSAAPVARST
jgi:hypothetical protein